MRSLKNMGMGALVATLLACASPSRAVVEPRSEGAPSQGTGRLSIHNADPSIIWVGDTYVAVESNDDRLYVRRADSMAGLSDAAREQIWDNPQNLSEVWAPEIIQSGATYYVYFAAGEMSDMRMHVIQSRSPASGYSAAVRMALPDDRWAIDGTAFPYKGQWYFVWSGWEGDRNGEQTLYLARMSDPTHVTGPRSVLSQPREAWERVDVNPPTRVNEGPQPIVDPNGQLHIVYSANGSWDVNYCLADLRLKVDGNPIQVGDWYKSNGCLFGAARATLMSGWEPTLRAKGVGHLSFALPDGDPNTPTPAGTPLPMAYHGVAREDQPHPFWSGRFWYAGTFEWWGDVTYSRGDARDTGWSLKFHE